MVHFYMGTKGPENVSTVLLYVSEQRHASSHSHHAVTVLETSKVPSVFLFGNVKGSGFIGLGTVTLVHIPSRKTNFISRCGTK